SACGPDTCGACPSGCTPLDVCAGGAWQCSCSCPNPCKTSDDCSCGDYCNAGSCTPLPPSGLACQSDVDCHQFSVGYVCRAKTSAGSACGFSICEVAPCTASSQCQANEACVVDRCIWQGPGDGGAPIDAGPAPCFRDSDCGIGAKCDPGTRSCTAVCGA